MLKEETEAVTLPDVWAESTPTISSGKLQPYIEAVKRSSQAAIHSSSICALEILNMEGLDVPPHLRDMLENAIANIIRRYIKDVTDDHNRWLHKQLADITSDLIKAQGEKKDLTKKILRQRKAILDYTRDGELDKLKKIVYEE